MRHSTKGILSLIALSLWLSLFCAPVALADVAFQHATLNPDFVKWHIKTAKASDSSIMSATDTKATGYIPTTIDFSHLNGLIYGVPSNAGKQSGKSTAAAISKYDMRPIMPALRDQGKFSTCWVFGAMAATESSLIIQKIASKDIDLSEWYLAYYAFNDESSELPSLSNPFFWLPYYNVGGNEWFDVALLSRGTGSVLEASAPYPTEPYTPAIAQKVYKLKNAYYLGDVVNGRYSMDPHLSAERRSIVKNTLTQYGAMTVSVKWSSTGYNATNHSYNSYDDTLGGWHLVTIVGWDDNYPKENFNLKPTTNGAWIVRNSWGSKWGEDGYFYMSYEDTTVKSGVAFESATAPKDEKIYQYDPLGCVGFSGYKVEAPKTTYFANIFTSTRDEKIDSVAFYVAEPGLTYNINIYAGCEANEPNSGTLIYTDTKVLTTPGFITVDMAKYVAIPSGTRFSIVIKANASNVNAVPVEFVSYFTGKATASPGQSFLSMDGTTWNDLTDFVPTGNVCLKAYTTPATSSGGCNAGLISVFAVIGLLAFAVVNKKPGA